VNVDVDVSECEGECGSGSDTEEIKEAKKRKK
jgi:hypothetical protein